MEGSFREQLKEIRGDVPPEKIEKVPQDLGAAAVKEKEIGEGLVELGKQKKERFKHKAGIKETAEILAKALAKGFEFGPEKSKTVKSAISEQINNLGNKLKDAEKSLDIINKRGTKEQIEERKKSIEFLRGEIEKAEKAKKFESERFKEIKEIKTKPKFKKEKINLKKEAVDNGKNAELKEIYRELDILGKKLVFSKKKAEKTKDIEEKNNLQNEINLIIEKRGKLKLQRDELKEKNKTEGQAASAVIESTFPEAEIIDKAEIKEAPPKEEQKLIEEVKEEIEKIPEKEREKIGIGLRNIGLFVQEWKSGIMASFCDKFVVENPKGTIGRFFSSLAETYKKDENNAQKAIEQREKSKTSLHQLQNVGYLTGNILKYGRTVADIVGWTVGSPLRYVMLGAQFFSRGAEAAKEARLKNQEVIEKTRVKDIDEAAEEAWKIYEQAKLEQDKGEISKGALEKAYAKNLPQDLLNRLKRSEPGVATGILIKLSQKILRKDVEFAIKHGKFSENSFERRLKEFDKIIGHYGTVDALAMGAKYAETTGKAIIAGVQIETAVLLMQRLPEIMSNFYSGGASVMETAALETKIPPVEKPRLEGIPMIGKEQILEKSIDYQGGKSIWQESARQLSSRFDEQFKNSEEALKTYNIDKMKDAVVDAIKGGNKDLTEKYGLTGIDNSDKITVDQLKNIKWENVFDDAFKGKGLTGDLSEQQMESIVKNNAALNEFFTQNPNVPRTIENYENILKGKGGVEFEKEISPEALKKAEVDIEKIQKYGYLPDESSPEEIAEEKIQRIFEGKGPIAMPEVLETEIPPTEIISKNVVALGEGWIKRGISIESLQKLAKEPAIAGRWLYLTTTEGKTFKVLGGFESKMAAKYALEKMTKMEK